MKSKNNNRKILFGVIALVIVAAALFALYRFTTPDASAGSKEVTIQVFFRDGSTTSTTYKTDKEYLGELLQEENRVDGEVNTYGLFITAVDGEEADSSLQEWWCITKNGERLNASADQTPLEDGASYELTLTVGY